VAARVLTHRTFSAPLVRGPRVARSDPGTGGQDADRTGAAAPPGPRRGGGDPRAGVALVLEDIDGQHPATPSVTHELEASLRALATIAPAHPVTDDRDPHGG